MREWETSLWKKAGCSGAYPPVIPALRRWRRKDQVFKASLGYLKS